MNNNQANYVNESSIIIPTFNAAKTIADTLKSVFNSVYRNFEVIIIDDCSTDNTIKICKDFSTKIIELKENRGPAFARNEGVRNSKSEILIFLDSDVVFPQNLFNDMLSYMRNQPNIAGVGTISSPVPLNQNFYSKYFALKEYQILVELLHGKRCACVSFICTRCGCLRRSVFEEMGGFNESYKKPSIEDFEFSTRMGDKYKILYDKELLNNHYFPDTFLKICRRYYRNSREMVQLQSFNKIKQTVLFKKDAYTLLLIDFSIILFVMGIFIKLFFLMGLITFLITAAVKKNLLEFFYKTEGLYFMIKGWFFYCIFSLFITAGSFSGFLKSIKRRFDTNSKDYESKIS